MKLSPVKILRNEKGFYLGRQRWDMEFMKWFPHERVSSYYKTIEEVNNAMVEVKA